MVGVVIGAEYKGVPLRKRQVKPFARVVER
jgi:hypothetical protein